MKLDWQSIQKAIREIIDEYKFEGNQVVDIVKLGIKSAFRKDYLNWDKKKPLSVTFTKNWDIVIYREYEVVEDGELEDQNKQMEISEAQKYKEEIKVWEKLYIDITPQKLEFSRISVQAAAQTIKQNMKKIERERFFEKFKDKEGELLRAKILKTINDNVVLDVEGTTVILPPEWQIPNRLYNEWEEIIVLLKQISKGQWWVTLDITQSSDDFIRVILEKTVPELEEEKVQIDQIVRIPWVKSKVLVSSDDENVDPVGVFVGQNWVRINNILSLLDWEKIEFIQNYEKPELLVKEAMKPAKVNEVELKGNTAYVTLQKNQRALAIWKQASNIKLVTRLTGYKVEVQEEEDE